MKACSDFHSVELYKVAISKIGEILPGASLYAVPLDQIPHRSQSRARVLTGPSYPEAILRIIKASNKDLLIDSWRVAKVAD